MSLRGLRMPNGLHSRRRGACPVEAQECTSALSHITRDGIAPNVVGDDCGGRAANQRQCGPAAAGRSGDGGADAGRGDIYDKRAAAVHPCDEQELEALLDNMLISSPEDWINDTTTPPRSREPRLPRTILDRLSDDSGRSAQFHHRYTDLGRRRRPGATISLMRVRWAATTIWTSSLTPPPGAGRATSTGRRAGLSAASLAGSRRSRSASTSASIPNWATPMATACWTAGSATASTLTATA